MNGKPLNHPHASACFCRAPLPFVASALWLWSGHASVPVLGSVANIAASYGLLILAFMAGVQWGQKLSGHRDLAEPVSDQQRHRPCRVVCLPLAVTKIVFRQHCSAVCRGVDGGQASRRRRAYPCGLHSHAHDSFCTGGAVAGGDCTQGLEARAILPSAAAAAMLCP